MPVINLLAAVQFSCRRCFVKMSQTTVSESKGPEAVGGFAAELSQTREEVGKGEDAS